MDTFLNKHDLLGAPTGLCILAGVGRSDGRRMDVERLNPYAWTTTFRSENVGAAVPAAAPATTTTIRPFTSFFFFYLFFLSFLSFSSLFVISFLIPFVLAG